MSVGNIAKTNNTKETKNAVLVYVETIEFIDDIPTCTREKERVMRYNSDVFRNTCDPKKSIVVVEPRVPFRRLADINELVVSSFNRNELPARETLVAFGDSKEDLVLVEEFIALGATLLEKTE